MTNEFAQDDSLVSEFLVESEELLQGMDQDMVALESAPTDAELLNRIFRAMHTIKGTAGFLGFQPVVSLSHHSEDVLNALRRGDVRLSRRMMDALLSARDQLGRILADIRQKRTAEYPLEPLLHELDAVQHSSEEPPRLGDILAQSGAVSADAIQAALHEQTELPPGDRPKLGEILIKKGEASPAQIGAALVQQKRQDAAASSMQTMRVDVRKLDELINLVGELVLERNRLSRISRDLSTGRAHLEGLDTTLSQSAARLSFITEELQVASLKTRMVPVDTVFRKYPRLVRDLAATVGKEVQLSMSGQETEMDKTMVELIGDPLVHLIRNALDHGIELPDQRAQAGKARCGTVRLEACQEGDQIVVTVADDGIGIDPDRIARKAVDKGLVTPERLRALTPREVLDFIFVPGFSTAERVNNLSGRGVGMDVVRSNLRKLNGTVELDSTLGQGTTVRLHLPLTLAILPVLLVEVANEIYALPLRCVIETMRVRKEQLHSVDGREVIRVRDKTLALLRLSHLFAADACHTQSTQQKKAVILSVGDQQVALLVDELIGQESTVIKPLGTHLHHDASLSGATISGDGRVRLVLDPAGLIASVSSAGVVPSHGVSA